MHRMGVSTIYGSRPKTGSSHPNPIRIRRIRSRRHNGIHGRTRDRIHGRRIRGIRDRRIRDIRRTE
jgi:hypothetical protein